MLDLSSLQAKISIASFFTTIAVFRISTLLLIYAFPSMIADYDTAPFALDFVTSLFR